MAEARRQAVFAALWPRLSAKAAAGGELRLQVPFVTVKARRLTPPAFGR